MRGRLHPDAARERIPGRWTTSMTCEVMARTTRPGHPGAVLLDPRAHRHLYLANATVLLAHQVDAAHWREWTLFGLPGGIQLFVLLNVPIVAAVLVGLERLGSPTGQRLSLLLAVSGLFAAAFHGGHLLDGDDAFRTPVSLLLLLLTALLSPFQLAAARRATGARAGSR